MRRAGLKIVMLCVISYGMAAANLPMVYWITEDQSNSLDYTGYVLPKITPRCAKPADLELKLLALPDPYADEDREPRDLRRLSMMPAPKPIPHPGMNYNITKQQASIARHDPLMILGKRTVTGNGGRLILEPKTAKMFARLEHAWGERLTIRWAYRDRKLNKRVGGAGNSFHIKQMAVDVVHNGWSQAKMKRFVKLAHRIGFRGFGMGRSVIHIDTRPNFYSWNYGGNNYGLAGRLLK